MLIICGIGLKPKHITLEAVERLKECDRIFIEAYTSYFAEGSAKDLEKITGKKIFPLYREDLEGNLENFLDMAKRNKIALLILGNVFSATTHMQIYYEAKKKGIKTEILPGISILNFVGKTGLEEYKFGRIVSIPFWQQNYKPKSFYAYIKNNISSALHTLCLLDLRISKEEKRFMTINEALEILRKVDEEKILSNRLCIAMCGVSSAAEEIVAERFEDLSRKDFSKKAFPQCLIICAELNEKEKEFVGLLG